MSLAAGTRLGPYEIVRPIGAGGMGEVYQGRDTRLDRIVAVKVLPSGMATQPEARQRFEREARAVSSLNHPHICTLHDVGHEDGIDFLVMEYLEGETLHARLSKGPLPLEQVLRYSAEISGALAHAHRRGIFHRDLKPGNVMLTKSGAKLLDFGLAKLRPSEPVGAGSGSLLATQSLEQTEKGTIVGTLLYMAPEQLEGKEADARTDLFALGAVIYEMATGRKAFAGKSQASVIAAILEREPSPIASISPALDRVVRLCLAKDPEERWQSALDLQRELEWIGAGAEQQIMTPAPRKPAPWIVAAVALLAAAAALVLMFAGRASQDEWRSVRLSLAPPEDTKFDSFAISPDGRRLAFAAADSGGNRKLWVRALDSVRAQPLAGTEGGVMPFWSPDGHSIGFFAAGKLKRIELAGGPAQILCTALSPRGGSWSRDGVILFVPSTRDPVFQVPATGGDPKTVTTIDASRGENSHRWPQFLPDGRHFLYFSRGEPGIQGVYAGSLDGKTKTRLIGTSLNARYAPGAKGTAHLLFVHDSALLAQPLDLARLRVTGEPFRVAEPMPNEGGAGLLAQFSASETGVLVFEPGEDAGNLPLLWLDRTGTRLGSVGPPRNYLNVSLSPDGRRVATDPYDPQTANRDIWIFDVAGGTGSRLTLHPSADLAPVWSPDGARILFVSERDGPWRIYSRAASGAGADELFLPSIGFAWPFDWSRDGYVLYMDTDPKTGRDLWVLPASGDRKAISVVRTSADENMGQFSPAPEGAPRWIAYMSNESGQGEIYVRPFAPGAGETTAGRWQVSAGGGGSPRWRRDGRELFYLASGKLMAVEVKAGAAFAAGAPRALFSVRPNGGFMPYDVSADGQRFLVAMSGEEKRSPTLTVALDWTAGRKR